MAYFINNKKGQQGIHVSQTKKKLILLFVFRREGFSVGWKISVKEEIRGGGG